MMHRLWGYLCRLTASGRLWRDTAGQSTVEFAVVVPVFFLVVFGFIQIGLWTFGVALTQIAVSEGCRAGVALYQPRPAWWDGQGSCGGWSGRCDPTQTNNTLKLLAKAEAMRRTSELIRIVRGVRINYVYAEIGEEVSRGARGREGTREIVVTADVNLITVVPYFGSFHHMSQCRMRLERFYSY